MRGRTLIWQLPLALLVAIPLWSGALQRFLTLEPGQVSAPVHQDLRFILEGVVFSQASQGVKEILLRAKRLHGSDDQSVYTLEGADLQRLGANPAHITSGQAEYDPERRILTLLDDVVVETADLVVKTPVMRYLAAAETLKSAAEVSMTGHGLAITGTSFMYNLASGDLRVGERVRCLYTPVEP